MIAATIGRKFLLAYNRKFGTHYDAKTFFTEQYFPLFFDHEKYMQWVTNSPFVQGIKKGKCLTAVERREKLRILQEKIERDEADASIAIGFPSLDSTATTSGQITNLKLPVSREDVYLSWIGSGFGVGVQGGLSILFEQEQILMALFEGWRIYREYLERMQGLRGNQINTWNGQWLAHYFSDHFIEDEPLIGFQPFAAKEDGYEVVTRSWKIFELDHYSKSVLLERLEIDSVACICESDCMVYEQGNSEKRLELEIPVSFRSIRSKGLRQLAVGVRPFVIPDRAYLEELGLLSDRMGSGYRK